MRSTSLLHDLAYSLRTLRKNPWFALTVLISLAIGIGASTTIFTVIDAFLLRALPGLHEPRQLINVRLRETGDPDFEDFSWPSFNDLRQADTATSGLATFTDHPLSFTRHGEAQLVVAQIVSANYFDVLGVKPHRGRFFVPDEDGLERVRPVVVVSHAFWQHRLGGDPRAVDSQIVLNGVPLTVVGIAPRGFTGTFVGFVSELWVPNGMAPALLQRRDLFERKNRWLEVLGRLRPGGSVAQARASMNTIQQRLARVYPEERNVAVEPAPWTGFDIELRGGVVALLSILMAVSLLVLAIACINVANLALARGVMRGKEIAIRLAIGVGRWRLVRQLLTESMVLAVLGGAAGVLAAGWGVALLRSLAPPLGIPLVFDFTIDSRVLGFALLLSLLSGAAFGLFPALQVSRPDLVSALKDSVRRPVGRVRLPGLLVAGQVAVSALLLITAGLFLRALERAGSLAPGFEPRGVEVVTLDPSVLGYDAARSRDFFLRLAERLGALPGVERVAMADKTPLGLGSLFGGQRISIRVAGRQPPAGMDGFKVEFDAVGPGYLEALRLRLLRGREIRPQDRAGAPRVAVVNETMARHFWPGEDPIGKRFSHEGHEVEVVGLARDSKYVSVTEAPHDHLYLAFAQRPRTRMALFLRTSGNPASLAPGVREEVRRAAPSLPILNLMTMNESIAVSRLPQRVAAAVASALGAIGLLLAAIGLYGVVAYSVSQRRREISIRMAVGADRGHVLGLVLRQGITLAVGGVVAGMLAALALGNVLSSLLVGLSPSDPLTFAVISLLLLAIASLASLLPARRASRADPMTMFREG
jgi:predicted permease